MRQLIVGVMGSGNCRHQPRSTQLGCWLAGLGVHLLTGGGGGVMAAVSEAFFSVPERSGKIIGVLPSIENGPHPPTGYPNRWVEIALQTHLPFSGVRGGDPLSRNHINVLSAHVVVALPGGMGTSSEVCLALEYQRPVIAFLDRRTEIPQLPEQVQTGDFSRVQAFVKSHLGAHSGMGAPPRL